MEFIHWDCAVRGSLGVPMRFGCRFAGRGVAEGREIVVQAVDRGERVNLGRIVRVFEYRKNCYLRVQTTKGRIEMTIAPLVY